MSKERCFTFISRMNDSMELILLYLSCVRSCIKKGSSEDAIECLEKCKEIAEIAKPAYLHAIVYLLCEIYEILEKHAYG